MWTIRYRGGFIHGYCDREECKAQLGGRIINARSIRSAKIIISRRTDDRR